MLLFLSTYYSCSYCNSLVRCGFCGFCEFCKYAKSQRAPRIIVTGIWSMLALIQGVGGAAFYPAFPSAEQEQVFTPKRKWVLCCRSERSETLERDEWNLGPRFLLGWFDSVSPIACSLGRHEKMKMTDSLSGPSAGLTVRGSRFRTCLWI